MAAPVGLVNEQGRILLDLNIWHILRYAYRRNYLYKYLSQKINIMKNKEKPRSERKSNNKTPKN